MKIKSALLSFIVSMVLYSNLIYSQQDSLNKKAAFILKADILLPLFAFPDDKYYNIKSLTTEICFAGRHSIQLTALFYKDLPEQKMYQIIPEYKYFLNKKKQYYGYYCGAFFNYVNWTFYPRKDYPNTTEIEIDDIIGGGVIAGYQRYFFKRLTLDFLIGIGDSKLVHRFRNYTPIFPN